MGRKVLAAGQTYAGELYVYGLTAAGIEVPFGHAQEWSLQDNYATVNAEGNDSLSPLSVAVVGRSVKLSVKNLQINPEQLGVLRGVTPATATGVASPVAGLTLGAATGSDATWGTTGYLAAAYTVVDAYGFESALSPVATVNIDGATKHSAVTTVSPPGGCTVNWYVSKALYGTAPLAAAATLYWLSGSDGTGFNLVSFPTSTRVAPTVSQIVSSRTVVSMYGDDVPSTFTIRTWSPSDASGMRVAFYGCFCPDLSINAPLKDFWNQSTSFDVLGNGGTPPKLYDLVLPASA